MSAITSAIDICQWAMVMLGTDPAELVSIVTPTNASERVCASVYDGLRRKLLMTTTWNFATKRTTISRDAVAPAFGYDDAYNLPPDCLRIIAIGPDLVGSAQGIMEYTPEGRQVLLNASGAESLHFKYTYDCTAVGSFDPLFTEILAHYVAISGGYALTKQKERIQQLAILLQPLIAEAKAVNGQQNPVKVVRRSRFINARRGSMSSVVSLAPEED